ncbi:hypothetical protein E1B28_004741 [Marasmius oreades]|uniref:Uncharacterized protein n=1 Tax=Marasmius oreades TaxID=181124 RepID=A0A9P8AD43_9AGAR|nr:uncharacterized protein E1B28_004741 [Marasmius oreades]KAG7097391.1 hypothetical protein E1B28_004741 [Marasmius oreades]
MPGTNKSATPPPEYTPSASNSHGIANPNYGAVSGSSLSTPGAFDPQNPFHNPWSSIPAFTHGPHPGQQQPLFHSPPPGTASHSHHWQSQAGPTPTGQLHIPYAYYDPRSEHSMMQADSRARWRFCEALAWIIVTWFVLVLVVQGILDGRLRFEWGKN